MLSLSKIAKEINGELVGADLNINSICQIDKGQPGSLSFIDNPIYIKKYKTTKCSALIVNNDFKIDSNSKISIIKVDNPRLGLLKAINLIYPNNNSINGVSASSIIHEDSIVGKNLSIGHHSIISENVTIGDNVIIGNNVSIEKDTVIGSKTIIQSGAVIGADGFGTVKNNNLNSNMPHIGRVVLGEDIWIGSNTTIDRGSIGETMIGDNTKIDNLIQIAHNVEIGKSCLIASGTAIAGTTIIGNNVSIGGQVGIVGHLSIGHNCLIGAQSLVTKSFSDNLFISGTPAKIHKDRIKEDIALRNLPQFFKKIKDKV